ncbi:hypothetical protein EMCRGX_G017484 [Ephydatia muelleri]
MEQPRNEGWSHMKEEGQEVELTLEYEHKRKSIPIEKGLDEDLRSHLIGALQNLVLALLDTKAMYNASCLRKAMKGLGTDEDVLIEILCTRTNQATDDMRGQGSREEGSGVDQERAVREAKELYNAGEGRLGTDEAKFTEIIGTRSFAQLRATFEEYNKIAHQDIISSIEREMSGDLKEAFKTIDEEMGVVHYVYIRCSMFSSVRGQQPHLLC